MAVQHVRLDPTPGFPGLETEATVSADLIEDGPASYYDNIFIDWPIKINGISLSHGELCELIGKFAAEQLEAQILAAADSGEFL